MYRVSEYSSGNIKEAFESKKNVIIPLGAIEAHSDHLPLSTDSILVEEYCSRLAKETDSLLLPVIPFGQVWSLQNAPGSIQIEEETFVKLLVDVLISLSRNGVKMATMVSSHFGNVNAMKAAARRVYEKYPIKVIYFIYPGINETREIFENLNSHSFFIHADEVETSLMMHVKPEAVHMELVKEGLVNVPGEVDYTPVRWTEFSENFIIGDATKSSPEKGKKALDIIVKRASEIILSEKSKLKGE